MTSEELMYRLGFAQGEEVGYGRAEEDMRREWAAISSAVKATSRVPTTAELAERRRPGGAIYEARMRRHGGREYQGGPVNFWTGQSLKESA